MKVKFNRYKNIMTDAIFYALVDDPVIRSIDSETYIEVTQDFKRAHLVLLSSLHKDQVVEINL
jgi:hypothetical protein